MQAHFHLAFHVRDLEIARDFYGTTLGCKEGRSTASWVDFEFYGHQLSLHLGEPCATTATGHVGEHTVPMPHFGVVLGMGDWRALADRLVLRKLDFVLAPTLRFIGEPGEQATMFFLDPSGNAIEIKGFAPLENLYAT